ncbi:MAG TPA: protein kinase, partial [Caldimonas sp.]|nr:protein kinase [Caldimonas sp.]
MLHDPSYLAALSRLLDEALDLAPAQVEAWLASLPPEHGPLIPRLREMLAEHLSDDRTPFLSGGPQLEGGPVDGSVAHAGDRVGPYRLISEIGSGGMGAVWLAERADGSLKRHIALKLPRLAWGAGLAERMARERDIGALLEHPNIARLYDAGVDALGRPYLAFEYIEGLALDAWCEAKALTVAERLRLFLQVVRAVAYAHGRLVVHRDLKPSNVLVTPDGQARLLDFGIAKLLQEGAADDGRLTQEQGRVFTPHFASPEQLRGEAITVASDVYSLGVLLYDLLTGQHPYAPERKSLGALEQAILEGEPALASSRVKDKRIASQLRGELDSILAKTLKREPSQRYATADALAEDIERHLHGERVLAQPDSMGYRMATTLRRHRVGFGAAAAIGVAVLSGAGVAIVQAKRASDSAERARVVKEFVVDVFKVNSRDNPANNELRQLPAELLLERGAKLIETKFPGQPQLQAELFGVVSGIFADMGASQLAADYATHQVETLATIHASEAEQAQATMLLAQALARQGRLADAEIRARRALELAGASSLLSVQARIGLAEVLFSRLNDDLATQELDEADQVLATITRAPTTEAARATFLRAQLLSRHGRFKEAMPQFERAIDSAVRIEGPLSRSAVAMRLRYFSGLTRDLQLERARVQLAGALAAMRASGGPNDVGAALAEAQAAAVMFDNSFASGE